MQDFILLLSKVPTTAWVAFFTALLTSLLTLTGIRYTNKANNERLKIQLEHEQKLKKDELLRSRLEEVYVESKKYMNSIVSYFLPYSQVMLGELTYNQALDLTIEKGYSHNPERVHLIMDMYFPELRESFSKVEKHLDKTNKINHAYKLQYKQGDTSSEKWLPLFQESLEQLSNAANNLRTTCITYSKKHIVRPVRKESN